MATRLLHCFPTTVVLLCKGALHFSAPLPLLMQLPFLLAFLICSSRSLLSIAHSHPLSYTPTEDSSIMHRPFIYETVAASFLAPDSQGGSSLHSNVPKEESDIQLVDDGVEKNLPIVAKPFIFESVAASFHSRANTQRRRDVLRINAPLFIYESVAASLHATAQGGSSMRDSIRQDVENVPLLHEGERAPITRKEEPILLANPAFIDSMHLEADYGSYLHDSARQGENSFPLEDGGTQSRTKREEPIIGKTSFIYESAGASILSGARGGSLLRDNMDNIGGKQVPISPSIVAPSTQGGGDALRDRVPQEKSVEFLYCDDGHLLLRDVGRKELHIKERPAFKDELDRKNHMGNLRMEVDDSVESVMRKAHGWMPEAEAGTPNEENLRMVVGDSSNRMIEKGYHLQASSARSNPNVENLRMVVADFSHNRIQNGYQARSRSCTSNSNVCSQLAHEEYLNHIVLYGHPSRLRRRQPACCRGRCMDLSDNDLHCGICGLPCLLLETCCNGKCVNLDIDHSNCGECGNVCPTSSSCERGMCAY